jgi:type IV pilus assembly protein PilB
LTIAKYVLSFQGNRFLLRINQKGFKMRIGEALLAEGLIKSDQLTLAIGEQQKSQERLGNIIIKMGFVHSEHMARFIADHFNLPFVELKTIYKTIDPAVVRLVPEELALRFTVLPISLSGDLLTIAMFDPLDIVAEDTIRKQDGFQGQAHGCI